LHQNIRDGGVGEESGMDSVERADRLPVIKPKRCCNILGVCPSLSSGFELKYDRLSGDDDVKVNLWRGA
jgi:hypothetical protein